MTPSSPPIKFKGELNCGRRIAQLSTRLRQDSQLLRHVLQGAFIVLCLWIGVEFWLFMRWGFSGGSEAYVPRPQGAEGFLSLSALMSLWHWIQGGYLNTIHPASVFILLAILAMGLFLKKGFCSWLCPVGSLSESLWSLGRRIFGRNSALPRWLDFPFRGLKYFLLGYFLWAIFGMSQQQLAHFIYRPYNRMADVKMYLFFARLSITGPVVLVILRCVRRAPKPLVSIPVPLWRVAGLPLTSQPLEDHAARLHLYRLPEVHACVPCPHPGPPGQACPKRRVHRLLRLRCLLPRKGHAGHVGSK